MTIQQRIIARKIGALELLVGALPFELLFSSTGRFLATLVLAIGFYFAKKEFQGEFSLSDVFGLFTTKAKEREG